MNLNHFEVKKTGLLFFDMLNGFYHLAAESTRVRMKPVVEHAVLLMRAAREAGIPIFFAKGNHPPDMTTSKISLTDTDNSLTPWPNGVVTKRRQPAIAGEPSSEVIPELDPRPDDTTIPKYRWSAFFHTHLDIVMRARELDTLIISGGSTDVGVASTIFSAKDLDYHLIIVRDACGTSHKQEVHDMLMNSQHLLAQVLSRHDGVDNLIDYPSTLM